MSLFISIALLLSAHIAVAIEYFTVSAILLTIALSNLLSLIICHKPGCKLLLILVGATAAYLLQMIFDARQLTYLPPILIHFFVFLFFATSLFKNNTPVITRFALLIKGELSERQKLYSRQASVAWAIFMFLLWIEAMLVALFFDIEFWSLMVNFVNYVLVILMFIAEFMVRRIVLKGDDDLTFLEFLKSMGKIKINHVFRRS
jgi:uncharacterized membrane protein